MSSDNPQTGPDTGHAIDAARGPGSRTRRREKRRKPARPLDEATLRDLAMSYVARFATTGAKLERYLARKLRERGVVEDDTGRSWEPDVGALVASFVEAGYVDDEAYARARSRDLSARGYGARRVDQALYAAGVAQDVRETHAPGEAESTASGHPAGAKAALRPFRRPRQARELGPARTPQAARPASRRDAARRPFLRRCRVHPGCGRAGRDRYLAGRSGGRRGGSRGDGGLW